MQGICPITNELDEIRDSHIFPKFLWKHLKDTGGNVFRCKTKYNLQEDEEYVIISSTQSSF